MVVAQLPPLYMRTKNTINVITSHHINILIRMFLAYTCATCAAFSKKPMMAASIGDGFVVRFDGAKMRASVSNIDSLFACRAFGSRTIWYAIAIAQMSSGKKKNTP